MARKITFTAFLCLLVLSINSCSAPETTTSAEAVAPTAPQPPEAKPAFTAKAEPAKAEPGQPSTDTTEVIIALGNKKLTTQQLDWMQPNANDQQVIKIAEWWLENELLYEEAVRRGTDKEPKDKFIAELMRKRTIAQELRTRVMDAVQISDEQIADYYEKNKETDARLQQRGYLSFTHIKTKNIKDANTVLEQLNAGEDVSALVKQFSTHADAKKGGIVSKYPYARVQRAFGNEFFEELSAANKGQVIGPITVSDGYEIARLDDKTEPRILTLEETKNSISMRLAYEEKNKAFTSLLDSLKEKAADKIVKSPRLTPPQTPSPKAPEKPNPQRTGGATPK